MAISITDGSGVGRVLNVTCDKCGQRVEVPMPADGGSARDPVPEALVGWQRGIGQRDVCPRCQSRTDLRRPNPFVTEGV